MSFSIKISSARLAACVALAVVAAVTPARAAPASADDVARARELGSEGLAAYDVEDYATALDKLRRAYALYHAPTLGLAVARCLRHLGRLTESMDAYLEVTRTPLAPDAPPAFRDALQVAARERAAVLNLLPTVSVAVLGAHADDATLTLDGKVLDVAARAAPLTIDPGTHRIEARSGDIVRVETFTVRDGEARQVTLNVDPVLAPGQVAPTLPGPPSRAPAWFSLGLGGVSLAFGTILAGAAASDRTELDTRGCHNDSCPDVLRGEVSEYDETRIGSTTGFILGATFVAASGVLFLALPKKAKTTAQSGSLHFTWSATGLGGGF